MASGSGISILKPLGYQKKRSSCGYCNSVASSSSYYMSCENLSVEHYQELIDRGWRRSGTLYYKPDLYRSCCPQYTIRAIASEFRPKRSQRKAVNRWNNHILGAEYIRSAKILAPLTREEKRKRRDKFDLLEAVHKAEYSCLTRPLRRGKSESRIEPANKFEVTLEPDAFTKEKYDVFLRYQMVIHKDPKSRWGHAAFTRFLCHGLNRTTIRIGGKTQKLGSYHQCYRINGKLVAVAVLDLLPDTVSSVYIFYDPDYEQWEFGKISALRELALALERHHRYYYMGFYIHSCVKMRYKANFGPCYLLDLESLKWDLLDDEFCKKLDSRPYVSLSNDRNLATQTETELRAAKDDQDPNDTLEETLPKIQAPAEIAADASANQTEFIDLDEDSQPSDEEAEIPEGSLFKYNIPGVMKMKEVEQLDLAHWKLVVRDSVVDLEDLRGWEDWKMDDPYSIKGIVAELAATIGPKMLKRTAVSLF